MTFRDDATVTLWLEEDQSVQTRPALEKAEVQHDGGINSDFRVRLFSRHGGLRIQAQATASTFDEAMVEAFASLDAQFWKADLVRLTLLR